ncbi:MAG: hypothetical protein WC190_00095 [Candidatus Cloacimonadaceae bacterium]|nr:hypothetical protein [Candidatus Cloacimonadota bacterium]
MRCLIYARNKDTLWLQDYFPDLEAYLLKIVNKPLLEYALDFVSLLGVSELRIVSDNSTKALESYFGDGSKWGMKIDYALAHPDDGLKSVYLKNITYCKQDDLLIWNGCFFLQYDHKQIECSTEFQNSFYTKDKRFIFLTKDSSLSNLGPDNMLSDATCLTTHNIDSIVSYYRLSMAILKNYNKEYVLPGYSGEKDIFLGYNFVFPHSAEIHTPIMIGNNCRLQKNTLVGPNSIIGNNVIVDENSYVKDSIIYDYTYIGRDLDLDRKIVYKGNLINADNGEVIHIKDKVLVAKVDSGITVSLFNRTIQYLLALLLILLQLIPWLLLFLPYRMFMRKLDCERLINKHLKTCKFSNPDIMAKSWWGRFLLRLSLDKFEMIFVTIYKKRIYLVGNRLLTNTVKHRKLILDLPVYNPGAFSLAESVKADESNAELFYELEYINWISAHHNVKILFRCLSRRMIYGYTTAERTGRRKNATI